MSSAPSAADGYAIGPKIVISGDGEGAIGIGTEAWALGEESTAIGPGATTDPDATGAVSIGKDTTTWGLDLRRVTPKETWDVRSDEYYEHLTKGEVNWAHYQQDQRYQAAFKALGYDLKSLGTDTVASVQQIRHANQALDKEFMKAGNVSWKRHWEGKYDADHIVRDGKDLYVDGVRQKTLSEIYSGGGGRLDISDSDVKNTLGQGFSAFAQKTSSYTQVKKPDSLKIKNIPKVEAKRPANIPASWGPIK